VELFATRLLRRVLAAHPALFDRLGGYRASLFVFEPAELPFSFGVRPLCASVSVQRRGHLPRGDVTIGGPLVVLLALAEGRADGDAEFFSRRLRIEGDMEAALALRNALDDARLDLPQILAPRHGPARRPVQQLLGALRARLLAEAR
ncbi:MAG TPA: SCP2 domain-containing protein, partial [Alphaproteobacteria bacterium]|nr:SCP2 domain-containing protein [Alphaproteobacteria bacterium]